LHFLGRQAKLFLIELLPSLSNAASPKQHLTPVGHFNIVQQLPLSLTPVSTQILETHNKIFKKSLGKIWVWSDFNLQHAALFFNSAGNSPPQCGLYVLCVALSL
jgi:hypothetical protein